MTYEEYEKHKKDENLVKYMLDYLENYGIRELMVLVMKAIDNSKAN